MPFTFCKFLFIKMAAFVQSIDKFHMLWIYKSLPLRNNNMMCECDTSRTKIDLVMQSSSLKISVSFWSLVESCLIGNHTKSSFFIRKANY